MLTNRPVIILLGFSILEVLQNTKSHDMYFIIILKVGIFQDPIMRGDDKDLDLGGFIVFKSRKNLHHHMKELI